MQKFIIILFYVFAIVGISLFVMAYLQSILAIRKLHTTFSIGLAKSKECGFEYMEKESGITNLYRALNDPLNPLQQLLDSTLKTLLFTIGLFAVCVFIVVLYYFAKQPINAETGVPKPNFFDAWTDKSGWMSIVKLGIYIRYLLIPTVLVVLLFFYFKKSNQLYLPNYNETKEEWMENADPEVEQQKKETLARDTESTTLRQITVLGGLAARMFVMKLFYVPDIPISTVLLGLTDASMILALLLLILITKFNGQIQALFRDGYTKQVKSLNDNVTNLMESPVFKDYYVRNAQRMEKSSFEKFMPHHVQQLSENGTLHWYLEHHVTSNNELEFMKQEARTRQTGAQNKKITWSPVVNRIRADMNKLRQSQSELEDIFNSNLRNLLLVYTLPLFIILYVSFHKFYLYDSLKTVQGVVLAVVLLIIYVIVQNFVGTISTSSTVASLAKQ